MFSTMPRISIERSGTRLALPARREPYWGASLARGLFLGVRIGGKDGDTGGPQTWIARLRGEDGRQTYQAIGAVSVSRNHSLASDLAREWAKNQQAGVDRDAARTVADACRLYVDERRRTKGAATARDAELRFARTVYPDPSGAVSADPLRRSQVAFGKIPLDRLRQAQVERWRDGLVTERSGKDAANRTLTTLKAALNHAVARRYVGKAQAIEWHAVKAYENAGKRRDLFLELHQRRALIEAAQGSVRDLIEAATLTGARPGELVSAKRSQFDGRTGSLRLTGKTAERTIPLAPAAVALFTRLAKDKLGAALLLSRDGATWHPWEWSQPVRDAATAAKLPAGVCLYSLRHAWITEALTAGMSPLEVARLCGTSLAMIDRAYGHLSAAGARQRLAGVTFA
ncbi:MAG: tyrosine-type recombinase/integrase [Bryocella sp.]